jgi:hypothetical protein
MATQAPVADVNSLSGESPGESNSDKKFLFHSSLPERELALYGSLPAAGAVVVDKQGEADRTPDPVQTTRYFGVWKGFRREVKLTYC